MENLGDVATRVVMLTTQGLLETSMIILMILLCDWRIALVSLAGVAIFLVINTVMQNAGKQTKRLNAANEACVRANVVLGLDTMDIDGKELNPENHDIEVKNIEFSYDKRKIIDGISLTIPEKTTTAIVGPSGGGKTTLCNLVEYSINPVFNFGIFYAKAGGIYLPCRHDCIYNSSGGYVHSGHCDIRKSRKGI